MEAFDATQGAAQPLTGGGAGLRLPSAASPCEAPDWQTLYEAERVRADAATARVKELTWAETSARSRAGMLKWNLDRTRDQLEAAHAEVKAVRREAKRALFYESEVARLEALLAAAGVETSRRATMVSLRQDTFRLKQEVKEARGHKAAAEALGREVASLKRRNAELEAELAKLRGSRANLTKAHFGSKSEKQKKEGTGNRRGQQPGKSGHGRTPRPTLEERRERHDPPASQRTCACCGEPYVANGDHHRDRGQGPCPQDRPWTLAPWLPVSVGAGGDHR